MNVFKTGFIALGLSAYVIGYSADISFTETYTENFDTLVAGTGIFSATAGTQADVPGVSGWQGAKISGTGSAATSFSLADGSGNSGGLFSFGASGSSERALGALASGTNIMAFGASFINSSGSLIDSLTISFTAEFWRSSTSVQNILSFAYGIGSGTLLSSNFLSSTEMTAASALNVVGPAPVATNGILDGNSIANQATVSVTLTGLSWGAGQSLYIRFQDVNEAGNDAALAIDNLTVTTLAPSAVPEPSTYAAIAGGIALVGVIVHRRRKALCA